MASAVPSAHDYAYIIVRLKFTEVIRSLAPSSLFCHYGDSNDVFSIGVFVGIGETPIAVVLRYLRELAGFRLSRNFPMLYFICLFATLFQVTRNMNLLRSVCLLLTSYGIT